MSAELSDKTIPVSAPVAGTPRPAKSSAGKAPSIAQSMLGTAETRDWKRDSVLTLFSLFLHLLVLSTFAFIVYTTPQLVEELFTTVTPNEEPFEPIVAQSMQISDEKGLDEKTGDQQEENETPITTSDLQFEHKGPIEFNFSDGTPQLKADSSDGVGVPDSLIGNEMSGRMSLQSRKAMVAKFGGNSASEAAVAAGLKWLVEHQLADGSWTFQPSRHPNCKGKCLQDGTLANCPNGATALALLTFLGAGHTHFGGDYKAQVRLALDYLEKSGKPFASKAIDFRGSAYMIEGMYAHGLCTIALCECAAMTNDTRIRKLAKGAIDFIINVQNKSDGGWRYQINQPGDTSVVGFQVMALKSAASAKIDFPKKAFNRIESFLDSAQTDRGVHYVYVPHRGRNSGPSESMTAVGLLCRMYMGWNRRSPQLAQGVAYLDEIKPQPDNIYFNYYATQVMHHWGGEEWTRWNEAMRDQLVLSQHSPKDGHMAGSWDIADPHGDIGGRLYMTCFSTMTLEVYYRHLPIYDRENLKVDF